MKKSFIIFCLGLMSVVQAAADTHESFHVSSADIYKGVIVKKIWLQRYAMPDVKITAVNTTAVSSLPDSIRTGNPEKPRLMLGMDRKRAFVLVELPAYQTTGTDHKRVTDFDVVVTESAAGSTRNQALARTTAAANSVLASGTWHKIALSQKGIYKIDFDFFKNKLGISNAIPSSNIRLFGNGGTMLPEDNKEFRYDDLQENAIIVNDGGDGMFGQGDYLLFYANGPLNWKKDSANSRFLHEKHLYEDKSYYFINLDGSGGKRIAQQGAAGTANTIVSTYNDYQYHEEDLLNLGTIGKEWLGEDFSSLPGKQTSRTFNFTLNNTSDSVGLRVNYASVSLVANSSFAVYANNQQLAADYFGIADGNYYFAIQKAQDLRFPVASGQLAVRLDYTPSASNAMGYLNYLEVNYRKTLGFAGGQTSFRDWKSVGTGKIARFDLQNANGNVQVWDVTTGIAPVRMNGTLSGSTYSFTQDAAALHEYIAFDGSQYLSPEYAGITGNQNLHSTPLVDYVIVTDPKFIPAAMKLADFHQQRDNLKSFITTPALIYNEFSSGSQDVSAIRDFVKMLYDRAGKDTTMMPKYLLMLGDASYDYKNRISGNSNFVPTYESAQSFSIDYLFCNDDFFGILDSSENINDYSIANTLDIGMGRIPVQTAADADAVVEKIMHYKAPASLGPWRLNNTYIGDNEDQAGTHLMDAEFMDATVNKLKSIYNDNKIYLDSYPFVSTPGGTRCPDANKSINDQIYKGTFLVNYNGHGNAFTLAHERILTADDFNSWKNYDKLPFMVTATCDFSQFDNPAITSAGEKLILKKDGGVIALLTTTQAVYAGPNAAINSQFLYGQFSQKTNGKWNSFGEALRIGKNITYSKSTDEWTLANFRKFILMGDPALTPNFPVYKVQTESLKDLNGNATDSVKALGGYVLSGRVTDENGQLLSSFNGTAYVSFYDKPRTISVPLKEYPNTTRVYQVQDNIVYKGKATVTNGKFSLSFIAPKDLNYDFGKGKVSYYAENGTDDAAGNDTAFTVGGASDNPITEGDAPLVKPYMNDSLFRDGGITGTNSLLYVVLEDETGINVSGNNVGHDLTAVLDGDVAHPYIMNDYYETAPNTYKKGYVYFPVSGLADGTHSFTVKAWDVNNNSGEGTVNFVVYNGKVMAIDKLMNYPNPFSDRTHLVFEHNHPNENLNVQMQIYNTAGALVRTFNQNFSPEGSRTNEIIWDGTDNNGAKLPSGIYIYRMQLTAESGAKAMGYQKAVLIR